jgi:hypothetical protein
MNARRGVLHAGRKRLETKPMVLMLDPKPDLLRIPISEAYLAGRRAYAEGRDPWGAPYTSAIEREDFSIGWLDASDKVSVEFRAEAELNGERL